MDNHAVERQPERVAAKANQPYAVLPDGSHAAPSDSGGGYRGTEVPPAVALVTGLPVRGTDRRLLEHALGNAHSAFIGTVPTASEAAQWADEGGWVYEVRAIATWRVEALLQGRVPTAGGGFVGQPFQENEGAVESVQPHQIVRWGQVRRAGSGRLYVDWAPGVP